MWLNDLFWGIRAHFGGKLSLLGDKWHWQWHCGQILQKILARGKDPPPSGNATILGTFVPPTPPLKEQIVVLMVVYPGPVACPPSLTNRCETQYFDGKKKM